MDLIYWVVIILALCFAAAFIIKKKVNGAEVYFHLISMIRTTKPLKWFDRFAKIGKPLDWFAELGLILGFGAVAVDYLYGRNKKIPFRVLLFILSVELLSVFFLLFDLALSNMFTLSPLTKDVVLPMTLSFGIFGFAGLTMFTLFMQAWDIIIKMFAGKQPCPGVAPVIPGVEIPNVPITIPLHAWISLVLILIIHEGMHGIVARRNDFKVKSSGILLFGFIPIGAFVEPDEDEVKRAEPRKALRLFAAGPMANLSMLVVIPVIVLILALFVGAAFGPWASQYSKISTLGVAVDTVDQNVEFCGDVYASPAYGVLTPDMNIIKVNDQNVRNAIVLSSIVSQQRNKPVKFTLDANGTIMEKTLYPNELGSLGFKVKDIKNENANLPWTYTALSDSLEFLDSFFGWFLLLNLLIALVNFLPFPIFDGGRIAMVMLAPYFAFLNKNMEDTEKFVAKLFLYIILALLILNAVPLFIP